MIFLQSFQRLSIFLNSQHQHLISFLEILDVFARGRPTDVEQSEARARAFRVQIVENFQRI